MGNFTTKLDIENWTLLSIEPSDSRDVLIGEDPSDMIECAQGKFLKEKNFHTDHYANCGDYQTVEYEAIMDEEDIGELAKDNLMADKDPKIKILTDQATDMDNKSMHKAQENKDDVTTQIYPNTSNYEVFSNREVTSLPRTHTHPFLNTSHPYLHMKGPSDTPLNSIPVEDIAITPSFINNSSNLFKEEHAISNYMVSPLVHLSTPVYILKETLPSNSIPNNMATMHTPYIYLKDPNLTTNITPVMANSTSLPILPYLDTSSESQISSVSPDYGNNTQIEDLKKQLEDVKKQLEQHKSMVSQVFSLAQSNGLSSPPPPVSVPIFQENPTPIPVPTLVPTPTPTPTVEEPPKPPGAAPPPPPPPPNGKRVKKTQTENEKKVLSVEEMNKMLVTMMSEDREPAKARQLANIWIKKFSPKTLQKIIEDYPFMIVKFALHPKFASQRITMWEKELFSTLDEKTAKEWRPKKRIEIEKFTEDEIMQEIPKIKKLIEKKLAELRAAEKAKASLEIQGQMIDELKNKLKGRSVPGDQDEEDDTALLQQLEEEDNTEIIDF